MSKITVLSWMRNEEDLVPFFLRHYHFADEIIVWDNESTDGTRDALARDGRVEIREWKTEGEMRDHELTRMKSEEYRKTGLGWKFIVDADEFAWHPSMRWLLEQYDRVGITIARTDGFDMVCGMMPRDDGETQLSEVVKTGVPSEPYSKMCVIRDCVSVRYWHGAHKIVESEGRSLVSRDADIKLLHYRYLSLERVLRKAREYVPSEENKRMGLGHDNSRPDIMTARFNQCWRQRRIVI